MFFVGKFEADGDIGVGHHLKTLKHKRCFISEHKIDDLFRIRTQRIIFMVKRKSASVAEGFWIFPANVPAFNRGELQAEFRNNSVCIS